MSGTKQQEFFMCEHEFKTAIDSLVEYSEQPHALVGFMGGEPLLHPRFADYCEYALTKIPREKLGLWSTFPDAPKYRAYADLICKTFSCILLNDHSRDDIFHAPVLMASEEYYKKACPDCSGERTNPSEVYDTTNWQNECQTCGGTRTITDEEALLAATEQCWVQESWSASVNPRGAWFCEVAAALSDLFNGPEGWKVEPGWWKRTPDQFKEQRAWACRKCGCALPLERLRNSQDTRDDVSPGNLERLKAIKSRKVARGEYVVRDNFKFDQKLIDGGTYPSQTYKNEVYRKGIAARYGIKLTLNSRGYWDPSMAPHDYRPPSLYQITSDGQRVS